MHKHIEQSIERVAIKSIPLIVPKRHQVLLERLKEYLSDKGAVGYIKRDYENPKSDINIACRNYWESRRESGAPRLEDIVTAILISFTTGVAAGVFVEIWKVIPRLIGTENGNSQNLQKLKEIADKSKHIRRDLELTLMLYAAKLQISHSNQDAERKLIEIVARIRSGEDVSKAISSLISSVLPPEDIKLEYLSDVVRGVTLTEEDQISSRDEFPKKVSARTSVKIAGTAQSPILGCGEIVARGLRLKSPEFQSIEFDPLDWDDSDVRRISSEMTKPIIFPSGISYSLRNDIMRANGSRKILVGSDQFIAAVFQACPGIAKYGGFVTLNGGMVSHAAVLARGMKIPCIGIDANHAEVVFNGSYALVQGGNAYIFDHLPSEFHSLLL